MTPASMFGWFALLQLLTKPCEAHDAELLEEILAAENECGGEDSSCAINALQRVGKLVSRVELSEPMLAGGSALCIDNAQTSDGRPACPPTPGDCCPTATGVWLHCCPHKPENLTTPSPVATTTVTYPEGSPLCAANAHTEDGKPACPPTPGDCCPTATGVWLSCCPRKPVTMTTPEPLLTTTVTYPKGSALCKANALTQDGKPACPPVPGDCCPTETGVWLDCCPGKPSNATEEFEGDGTVETSA